jgi:hypothetical protein
MVIFSGGSTLEVDAATALLPVAVAGRIRALAAADLAGPGRRLRICGGRGWKGVGGG